MANNFYSDLSVVPSNKRVLGVTQFVQDQVSNSTDAQNKDSVEAVVTTDLNTPGQMGRPALKRYGNKEKFAWFNRAKNSSSSSNSDDEAQQNSMLDRFAGRATVLGAVGYQVVGVYNFLAGSQPTKPVKVGLNKVAESLEGVCGYLSRPAKRELSLRSKKLTIQAQIHRYQNLLDENLRGIVTNEMFKDDEGLQRTYNRNKNHLDQQITLCNLHIAELREELSQLEMQSVSIDGVVEVSEHSVSKAVPLADKWFFDEEKESYYKLGVNSQTGEQVRIYPDNELIRDSNISVENMIADINKAITILQKPLIGDHVAVERLTSFKDQYKLIFDNKLKVFEQSHPILKFDEDFQKALDAYNIVVIDYEHSVDKLSPQVKAKLIQLIQNRRFKLRSFGIDHQAATELSREAKKVKFMDFVKGDSSGLTPAKALSIALNKTEIGYVPVSKMRNIVNNNEQLAMIIDYTDIIRASIGFTEGELPLIQDKEMFEKVLQVNSCMLQIAQDCRCNIDNPEFGIDEYAMIQSIEDCLHIVHQVKAQAMHKVDASLSKAQKNEAKDQVRKRIGISDQQRNRIFSFISSKLKTSETILKDAGIQGLDVKEFNWPVFTQQILQNSSDKLPGFLAMKLKLCDEKGVYSSHALYSSSSIVTLDKFASALHLINAGKSSDQEKEAIDKILKSIDGIMPVVVSDIETEKLKLTEDIDGCFGVMTSVTMDKILRSMRTALIHRILKETSGSHRDLLHALQQPQHLKKHASAAHDESKPAVK